MKCLKDTLNCPRAIARQIYLMIILAALLKHCFTGGCEIFHSALLSYPVQSNPLFYFITLLFSSPFSSSHSHIRITFPLRSIFSFSIFLHLYIFRYFQTPDIYSHINYVDTFVTGSVIYNIILRKAFMSTIRFVLDLIYKA